VVEAKDIDIGGVGDLRKRGINLIGLGHEKGREDQQCEECIRYNMSHYYYRLAVISISC